MIKHELQNFPKEDYTFEIEQLLAEQGGLLVKYIPADVTLSAVVYNVPIWPDLDTANTASIKKYLDNFAPYDKWYAQKLLLTQGSDLLKKYKGKK